MPINNPSSVSLAAGLVGAGLKSSEMWDDFQRSDSSAVGANSPSGQAYYTSGATSHIVSNEMVNPSPGTSANYVQTTVASAKVFNVGCAGRFVFLSGNGSGGFTEGVMLLTDGTGNQFFPNNIIHIVWSPIAVTVAVSNTGITGLVGVNPILMYGNQNSTILNGEYSTIQASIEGNKLTLICGGLTSIYYSSVIASTTWTTATWETFYNSSTPAQDWYFDNIWINAPVLAGIAYQPRNQKLDELAESSSVTIAGPGTNVANALTLTSGNLLLSNGYIISTGAAAGVTLGDRGGTSNNIGLFSSGQIFYIYGNSYLLEVTDAAYSGSTSIRPHTDAGATLGDASHRFGNVFLSLPSSNPHVVGQLYTNAGIVTVSSG